MVSETTHKLPSERSFGVLFMAIFAAVGVYGVAKAWALIAVVVALGTSLALGVVTLVAPDKLAPLNKAWFMLGQLLGKIVNPIVLGVIFFGLIAPVAVVTRLLGRDGLRLKRRNVASYWIDRPPPNPELDSFTHQF